MWRWIRELDRILRGEATRLSALREGQIEVPLGGLCALMVLMGALYGFCMGWYALVNRESPEYLQVIASILKVPALFFLTLLVTFPSLYVFNALVGSRLNVFALLRLLIAALGVTLAVLASFGPIIAFFSLTTSSYYFMALLNVLLFAVAGVLGLAFLLQTLHRLTITDMRPPGSTSEPAPAPPRPPEGAQEPPQASEAPQVAGPATAPTRPLLLDPGGALERLEGHALGRNVRIVFRSWVVVFALVGAQMSWVLRPFIGDPSQPFQWFRPRQSHFFEAVWSTFRNLFS